jgi:hypothetical protein
MTSRSKIGLAILGVLVLVGAARLWLGFRSQPQLPPSDEVFKSVDALFTAVTSRDESRLTACERRLEKYHRAAKLPDPAWKRLKGVIATARGGQWESAAHRLYDFMQGQRREGVPPEGRSRLTAMNSK